MAATKSSEDGSDGPIRSVKEMAWEGRGESKNYTLEWENTAVSDDNDDDAATEINIDGARYISIVCHDDITPPWAGTLDVHVEVSNDGTTWSDQHDHTLINGMNDGEVHSGRLTPGPMYMKVVADVNGVQIPVGEKLYVQVRVVKGM